MKKKFIGICLGLIGIAGCCGPVPQSDPGLLPNSAVSDKGQSPATLPEPQLDKRARIENLQEINPDIVGYIQIEHTNIDYPVVQGRDNHYYLQHAYTGAEDPQGAIFWEAALPGGILTEHILLHGHNKKNQLLFSNLELFKEQAFFDAHHFISLETLYYHTTWEIVSVYLADSTEAIPLTFEDSQAFLQYAQQITERSLVETPGNIGVGDLLLTLNTCSYEFSEAHTLVCAKLVEVR